MHRKLCSVLLILCLLLPGLALGAGVTITVTGTGQVTGQPDTVTVGATVSARSSTLQEAQTAVSALVEEAQSAALSLGLTENDIVTSWYSVYPVWDDVQGVSTITGYQASHSMRFTCRDVSLLDPVVNALTDAGISQIDEISYASSAESSMYLQALSLAVSNAQTKAAALAAAAGHQSLSIVSVTEASSGGSYRVAMEKEEAAMDNASGFSTGVRAGSVSVSASVTVVFEILD